MAGDYYNSAEENPSNRANNTPGLLSQIFSAIGELASDIVTPKKFQDRGSAEPWTTDVLQLNAQSTPPAATSVVPENPDLRYGHQFNEPQFRFVSLGTPDTLSNANKPPLTKINLNKNFNPEVKGPIFDYRRVFRAIRISGLSVSQKTITNNVDGKKIIQANQVNNQPDGFSDVPGTSIATAPPSETRSTPTKGGIRVGFPVVRGR